MNKVRGVSILEAVVYVTILTVLFAVVVNSTIVVISIYREFDTRRDIQDSAITVIERITREIRNADSVSDAGSTFDTHPGVLVVSVNENGTPVVRQFPLIDGAVHVVESGIDMGPLTSADVEVTNLVFRKSVTNNSELVKIELTITGGVGSYEETENFYTSVVLRGSYDGD